MESRKGLLTGGSRGAAVLPRDSEQSRLIQAPAHLSGLKMPAGGKVPQAVIQALERWVILEAPWDESEDSGNGGR